MKQMKKLLPLYGGYGPVNGGQFNTGADGELGYISLQELIPTMPEYKRQIRR